MKSEERDNGRRGLRRTQFGRSLAQAQGMTIVELMIVLTIIASIMGVVGFFVFGALDRANISEARIEITQLTNMCDAYYMTTMPKKMPDELNDLAEGPAPLTQKVPDDPWGNPYIYKKEGNRKVIIYSAGPDGVEGSEDDVRSEDEGDS